MKNLILVSLLAFAFNFSAQAEVKPAGTPVNHACGKNTVSTDYVVGSTILGVCLANITGSDTKAVMLTRADKKLEQWNITGQTDLGPYNVRTLIAQYAGYWQGKKFVNMVMTMPITMMLTLRYNNVTRTDVAQATLDDGRQINASLAPVYVTQ